MKKWVILTGVIAVLLTAGFFLLSYYGVKFITSELQRRIGPGITVSEIKIRPTHLYASGIRYEVPECNRTLVRVEELRIYPALLSSITGEFRIRELAIVRPSVYVLRSGDGAVRGPWPVREKEKRRNAGQARGKAFQMKIDKVLVEKGAFEFEDRSVEGPPAGIHFNRLDLEIKEIQFPASSVHSQIVLKGISEGSQEGVIETTGWMDLNTLDMDLLLKVTGMDMKRFEPYYRRRVSAEVDSAYMDLEAKIRINNRVIDAPGQLQLSQFRIKEGAGSVLWIPATTLVALLKDKGNRIKIAFHVKGDLNDPRFSLQESIMRRMGIAFAESLGLPIKVVGEEVFKGTLKGAEGLAEGLRSFQELFRPSKEKK